MQRNQPLRKGRGIRDWETTGRDEEQRSEFGVVGSRTTEFFLIAESREA